MSKQPDFKDLWARWGRLGTGPKAELRRVRNLKELLDIPAFYRLTGNQSWPGLQRVVFCIPWATHREHAGSLGSALAQAKLSEKRLFQIIRSTEPNDLIQLRRILQHVQPKVDWARLGKQLYWWQAADKQRLIEDFYYMPNTTDTTPDA